ncbi:carbamoyltransferase HypF [Streptomyces sp. DSM 42041]|uniref:acylphosphatase n=1 Tax=Streptomyces hazeniae TaxID=3075538 RepID=A0ABU2NS90_9ACTN|nr:carbamoyltransferase HypF [Streptomyces sp. DSM 42041]MDT0379615.1 carbamoyltransferase HypF [Streptomyces sp. DSM 42041]
MSADALPAAAATAAPERRRCRVTVRGVVQGVGFRPFVYALATELGLHGHVANTPEGVVAEAEGAERAVAAFLERLATDAPPLALVESVAPEPLPATGTGGSAGFAIHESRGGAAARTLVSPDTATCADCLAELCDPADRRYRHPFLTCTHCGPRFTIVTALPYDRAHTTMAGFPMCADCAREYADPADRRFHAQPVACHACGPRLRLLLPAHGGGTGVPGGPADPADHTEYDGEPVARVRELLAAGAIVAVKGLGGYHLACDAANPEAVRTLRRRKARGDKPFALMARELADLAPRVHLGTAERDLLTGPARPIVLLRRRPAADVPADAVPLAEAVAPRSADLGVMLPYTPVHHLLLGLPGDPPGPRLLVMTSGNLGGEPIVTGDDEALERLAGLADAWLVHERPIHVPCDDSVLRVVDGETLPVRRSRGHAPFPVTLPFPVRPALAVGGDLKNTFCLGRGRRAWLSAHIGDMDDLATLTAFTDAEAALEGLTGVTPEVLAADRHPGYRSTGWARRHAAGRPLRQVQHHHAHVAAAMAEAGHDGARPVLGVAFDGTGYGDDGAVWGGEFLLAGYDDYRRFAHLGYAALPGGDAAVRHTRRMALSHLHAAGLPWDPALPPAAACAPDELRLLARQLERGLHCVPTSSMGRLFDAVSSLAGICHHAGYEAQAAVELEAAAHAHLGEHGTESPDPAHDADFALRPPARQHDRPRDDGPLIADPAPVIRAVADAVRRGDAPGAIAARFHACVARLVRRVCAAARDRHGTDTVALSGGVFANALLARDCVRGLRADGFTVLTHRLVPPNDGGLALGQLVLAAREDPAGPAGPRPDESRERGGAHVSGGTRQGAHHRGA